MEIEKIKAVVLLIATRLDTKDMHKIFKVLYFAEKKHILKYGRTIINENFIKMENGPVPSLIYDLFKSIREKKNNNESYSSFYNAFSVSNYLVTPLEDPNMDYLSESNLECILASINENASLNFNELTEKSHDLAWERSTGHISEIDIAIAEGANPEFLSYITELSENKKLSFV